MSKPSSFPYVRSSPETADLADMPYVRYTLSLRKFEDFLHERHPNSCHKIGCS